MNMIKIFLFTLILAFSLSTHADIDPLKNINEKTHNLNEALDLQLASPVARLYKRITPDFAEIGITNFTRNLEDLSISLNNILQGKVDDGFSDLIRFVTPVVLSPEVNQPSKYPFTDTPSAVAAVADNNVAIPVAAPIIFDLFILFSFLLFDQFKKTAYLI